MGKRLRQNIPNGHSLPNGKNGKNIPFCVVVDEALGLSKNILRPQAKKIITRRDEDF